MKNFGFTLAEVLITLGIIGVVAALTMTTLINNINNMQYKSAYKKAYSDFSNVLSRALSEDELVPRTSTWDINAGTSEWNAMKKYFKVVQECEKLTPCWVLADTFGEMPQITANCPAFVDISGRVWVAYWLSENIYLVDVNGSKGPNKFGKDRFPFFLAQKGENGNLKRVDTGLPQAVIPQSDILTPNSYCNNAPCYYQSWLY